MVVGRNVISCMVSHLQDCGISPYLCREEIHLGIGFSKFIHPWGNVLVIRTELWHLQRVFCASLCLLIGIRSFALVSKHEIPLHTFESRCTNIPPLLGRLQTRVQGPRINQFKQSYWLKALNWSPRPLDEGPRPKKWQN